MREMEKIENPEDVDQWDYRVPQTGFLRLREVLRLVAMSRSWVYEEIKQNRFPRGINVGGRAVRWRVEDIKAYLVDPIGWVIKNKEKKA